MAALHALRRVFVSFLCQGIVTVKSKAVGPAPTEPTSKSKGTKRSADEANRADIASDRARSLLEQFQSQLLAGLHAKPAPIRVSRILKLLSDCLFYTVCAHRAVGVFANVDGAHSPHSCQAAGHGSGVIRRG